MTDHSFQSRSRNKRWRRLLVWSVGLVGLAGLLNRVPGCYTLDSLRETVDPSSVEGIALAGVETVELNATLHFDEATEQRINRRVRLAIPAGSTVTVRGRAAPFLDAENGWTIALEDARVVSDKPLTFTYRNVPLAAAYHMESIPGDPEHRLRARGRYQVLRALIHLHRYRRERGPRREWRMPARARLSLSAQFVPEHEFAFAEGLRFRTGAQGGQLQMKDARLDHGQWVDGRLGLRLFLGESLQVNGWTLREMQEGRIDLTVAAGPPEGERARLNIGGALSLPDARLQFEGRRVSARLRGIGIRPQAELILDAEYGVHWEEISARLGGQMENMRVRTEYDRISVPLIDLDEPHLLVRRPAGASELHVSLQRPWIVPGLHWTRTRARQRWNLDAGRLRLEPGTFRLEGDEHVSVTGLHAGLEADRVRLVRKEEQWVALENGVRLNLGARRIRFHDGEILVEDCAVEGETGLLSVGNSAMAAFLRNPRVRLNVDRARPEKLSYEGAVWVGDNADVDLVKPGGLTDISVRAAARPMEFAGDQDWLYVDLPELSLSVSNEDFQQLLQEALMQNRERIREETEFLGRFMLDLRRIHSVQVMENEADVAIAGHVSWRGPRILGQRMRIRNSFTANFSAVFSVPDAGMLDEAEVGLRVFLGNVDLKRFPRFLTRRVPGLVDYLLGGALFEETWKLGELIEEIPAGIRVGRIRIHGEEDRLVLLVSGTGEIPVSGREPGETRK